MAWSRRPLGEQIDELGIEALASEVFEFLSDGVPVDPVAIALEEGIEVVGRDFEGRLEGRLEFHPTLGFVLFHQQSGPVLTPRERFSVAHELGHYYLHGDDLRAGQVPHNSRPGFRSKRTVEREADAFAAACLMPRRVFGRRVNETVADLERLQPLAQEFGTSLMSTAIRFARMSHFPCVVVFSENGSVNWAWRSEPLRERGRGIGWIASGSLVPPSTPSASPAVYMDIEGADVPASKWFRHELDDDPEMLEQVLDLPYGRLTMLSLDEDVLGQEEDEDFLD